MTSQRKILAAFATAVLAVLPAVPFAVASGSDVPERDERLRCACLEGRLDRVQRELRAGYDARRGRRLKERQRVLEDQKKTECR
jgi:hypothetical protein